MAKFNSRLKQGGAVGALLAGGVMAVQLIGGNEGERTKAYRDITGTWTICDGHTEGVRAGMVFTKAECRKLLGEDIIVYEEQMQSCLVDPQAIPIHVYVASLDFEYNVGKGNFCKSSIAAALNVGAYKEACQRQFRYTVSKGQRLKGLYNRRVKTVNFCMKDFAS